MNNLLTETKKMNITAMPPDLVDQRLPNSMSRGTLSPLSPPRMDPDEPRLRKQKHEDAVTVTDGSTVVVGERPLLNQSSEALTTLMDDPKSSKQKQTDTEPKGNKSTLNLNFCSQTNNMECEAAARKWRILT